MTVTAEINDAFSAALEQDAGLGGGSAPGIAPPPRKPSVVDPDAPHGRAEDGTPIAPYGVKADGKPRIKPAGPGRTPKDPDSRPRTSSRPAAPAGDPRASAAGRDYTKDLDDLADGFWMLLSGIPAPGNLRTRLQAQAAILSANKPHLVRGANIAAQHHDGTAQLVEKLTSGNAAWILPAMFAVGPFVAQSVQMWRSPAAEVQALADHNAEQFQAVVSAAMVQAQQEAAA